MPKNAAKAPPIEYKPVAQLELDAENPRLASATLEDDGSQRDLVKVLWDEMAVDEVALSIAANGFFDEEPLFAIPKKGAKDKFIVVEGNRRLAAVLLLRQAPLRRFVGATELPALSAKELEDLNELPVSVYDTREELWAFFGFRHINGPQPWDAYSKAAYVSNVHETYRIPLDEIARKIGDRHSIVKRLYRGYKVLRQAEQQASFERADVVRNRFYFSHLYTAVDYPEFQKFLGIDGDRLLGRKPVPSGKLRELKDLMLWIYGSRSKNVEPLVKSQNPDLNTLRSVVAADAGIAALRRGLSLERANEISIGDERRFREAMTLAKDNIQTAKGTITTGYKNQSDLMKTAEEIVEISKTVLTEMQSRASKKSKA